jgi:hypothetical protein
VIGLLLSLYPARWRRRYGEEFRAVLESRPLGPFDVADVLLGALDARLTPFRLPGTNSGGHLVLLRIGGFGAVFGAAAWFIGLAAASGIAFDEGGRLWVGVMVAGSLGLLVALIGLSAFQGHRQPRLAWVAFGIPAISTTASAVGAAGMLLLPEDGALFGTWSPWGIWMIGLLGTFVGSTLFAVATYRAAVLSRRAASALGGTSAVATFLMVFVALGPDASRAWLVTATVVGAFAASWMWLGIGALRRGPIRAIEPA